MGRKRRRVVTEYLVHVPCTWECEQMFQSQHHNLVTEYLTEWELHRDVVKVETGAEEDDQNKSEKMESTHQ